MAEANISFFSYWGNKESICGHWQSIYIRMPDGRNISHKVSKKSFMNFVKALDLVETKEGSGIWEPKSRDNVK
jgi:hypothetical protein